MISTKILCAGSFALLFNCHGNKTTSLTLNRQTDRLEKLKSGLTMSLSFNYTPFQFVGWTNKFWDKFNEEQTSRLQNFFCC